MNVLRVQPLIPLLIALSLCACNASKEKPRIKAPRITVTTVQSQAVTLTQQYVGQIHSHHHIKIRTPQAGILEAIRVKDHQSVKQNDLLFQVKALNGKESLKGDRESPKTGNDNKVVSITAPFDGRIDRLPHSQGSLVQQGDTLTTLSDNSEMYVYFNIPEARYLEYQSAKLDQHQEDLKIELQLANGNKFDQPGKFGAIGADFNSETGSVPFRVDFPNPGRLLHHGQIGTVLISRVKNDAIVVPQRATFEILNRRYVYVVDKDDVVHQRQIVIQNELEDLFVIETGVGVNDKIVDEGVRLIRDGDKIKYDDRQPKKVVEKTKHSTE